MFSGLRAHADVAYSYDFNEEVTNVFQLAVRLRFDDARLELKRIRSEQPSNLAPFYVEEYIDFISLMLSEDKILHKKLQAVWKQRLAFLENHGRQEDPFHLLIQSEIIMHRAVVDFRFDNNIQAFTAALKAYRLLEQNSVKFPDFIPNRKNLGLMHILIGSMPPSFKGGFSFFTGIEGSVTRGMKEVKSVMNDKSANTYIFSYEARILYAFAQLYINEEAETAWNILRKDKVNYSTQPLLAFLHASLAYRAQRGEECIRILSEYKYISGYFPIPVAFLVLGRAKLNRLDKDANVYLTKFLSDYKGQTFRKEAHLLLYWYYTVFINGDRKEFHRNAVLSEGSSDSDSDKAAIQEVKVGNRGNILFLKARLLYDGGFSEQALSELNKTRVSLGDNPSYVLEFNYRYARILQQKKDVQYALKVYQKVIKTGRNRPEYFACNSALQMAIIYEKSGLPTNARFYYNECLSMSPASYKYSLHAKAKAGLLRLNQK